jgi:hypothetical protein
MDSLPSSSLAHDQTATMVEIETGDSLHSVHQQRLCSHGFEEGGARELLSDIERSRSTSNPQELPLIVIKLLDCSRRYHSRPASLPSQLNHLSLAVILVPYKSSVEVDCREDGEQHSIRPLG